MRKLVTVREIDSIRPIPDADAIVCARIGGWDVVVKKDEFEPGDLCCYFEIDSFLPEADHRFQFLMKNKITWQGKVGARLKTAKLRGQVSQGLALKADEFPEVVQQFNGELMDQDFSELLGVEKWEPVIPAQLAGKIAGMFPSFIQKTDQERAQNIPFEKLSHAISWLDGKELRQVRKYEVTTKLEGSSMTAFYKDGKIGVCSRNLELKTDDMENSFVRAAHDYDIIGFLDAIGRPLALQFELMGPGIQGNHEGLTKTTPFLFDIYDIHKQRYMTPDEREIFCAFHDVQFPHVPILGRGSLEDFGITDMDKLIAFADGPSLNHKRREGVVFKDLDDPSFSFKVISNDYLLKC